MVMGYGCAVNDIMVGNEDVAKSQVTDMFKGPHKTISVCFVLTTDPNVYAPNYAAPKLYPRANDAAPRIVYQIGEIGRSQSGAMKSSWEWPSHRTEWREGEGTSLYNWDAY